MNEREFSIGDKNFKLSKIDAFKQFHIVRRIAPILADLIPMATKFSKLTPEQMQQDQFESLAPIMNGISRLSDADADLVMLGLLSAVEIQQSSGGWARIAVGQNMMFGDLDLNTMLNVAGRAFMYNMASFFAGMPQALSGGK